MHSQCAFLQQLLKQVIDLFILPLSEYVDATLGCENPEK